MISTERMDLLLRYRRALGMFGALLTALVAGACVVQQLAKGDADVVLFSHAGKLLITPPNDLYLSPVPPHNNYYYYPPFFAVICLPLNWLPEWLLLTLWTVVSILALAWSLCAFYRGMTARNVVDARERWLVIATALTFIARPTIDHLRFGQVNILLLAAAVFSLLLLRRQREITAGLVIGVSIAVKLLLAPFAVLFAFRRKFVVLAAIVVTMIAAVLLPALLVGVEKDIALHREWFDIVFLGVPNEWTSNGNISLAAQVMRFFSAATAFEYKGAAYQMTLVELRPAALMVMRLSISAIVLAALGFVALRFRKAPEPISTWGVYAFVFALIPCFSTVAEVPHLVLLAPPAIWLAHMIFVEKFQDRIMAILFAVSFALTTLTSKTFVGEYLGKVFASSGVVMLGVILLAIAIVRSLYVLEKRELQPSVQT